MAYTSVQIGHILEMTLSDICDEAVKDTWQLLPCCLLAQLALGQASGMWNPKETRAGPWRCLHDKELKASCQKWLQITDHVMSHLGSGSSV